MTPPALTIALLLTVVSLAAGPVTKPTTKPATRPSKKAAAKSPQTVPELKLTIQGRPVHPTVYMSPADIEQARSNRNRYPWAKATAAKLLEQADAWTMRDDAALIAMVPPPAACYAYGFTGCPVCGGTFKGWWGVNGVASLDDPRHVKCVSGHRLPDDQHPDSGRGYTDENGNKFYFVGTYNSFVIDELTKATTKLVHAYALTGEARYADKAALILDHLARIYPTSETGSWDYPSHPPSGRFNRPWYQVARTLVDYANQYDLLLMGTSLDAPSSVDGLTRRQNIERNLLLNGAKYCYEQSVLHPALHNGQADYIHGSMAVGVAMGIPQYVAWGVDGPYSIRAMIANNIDRDGQYYETSAGYSDRARSLYMNMAEMLEHYRDAAYPDGIRLIDDPVFVSFNLIPRARLRAATHTPNLGDDKPNHTRIPTAPPADRLDANNLERLRALRPASELDRRLGETLLTLAGGDPESLRAAAAAPEWLLFHARDVHGASPGQPATTATTRPLVHPLTDSPLSESDLFSQKQLAILRSGTGKHLRAVTLRAGPTLNHGHFDEMNLNVYARGYEMSYDLGYGLGSTHTQIGWAKQTASHNTVLVDERSQLAAGRSGGSIRAFATMPGLQFVSASSSGPYEAQGVTRYDRTVAMIDADERTSYLLDVFRVEGGTKHDYVFHARGTSLTTDGVELGPEQPGSLAGPDVDWGARQGSDGDIKGIAGKEYWNPPPGNGLGFLIKPRVAPEPRDLWSATWDVDPEHGARLRLNMLPFPGTTVTTAEAPGIYPHFPKSAYVLARRAGDANLTSTFAAVIEPCGAERVVRRITRLGEPSDAAVAVKVELTRGRTDYLVWRDVEADNAPSAWRDGGIDIRFDGMFAKISVTGDGPADVAAIGGSVTFGGVALSVASPALGGKIDRIDAGRNVLFTQATLPAGDALAGQFLIANNPAYAQASPYRIASVSRDGDLTAIQLAPTRLTIGQVRLTQDPTDPHILPNVVPLEYAKSLARKPSGFYRGKVAATADGKVSTAIRDIGARGMSITVESSAGFAAGQDVIVHDLRPGDEFTIPTRARATRGASGAWVVTTNGPATFAPPGMPSVTVAASRDGVVVATRE